MEAKRRLVCAVCATASEDKIGSGLIGWGLSGGMLGEGLGYAVHGGAEGREGFGYLGEEGRGCGEEMFRK